MLETEARNQKTMAIDKESTENMLRILQTANEESVKAVEVALPEIAKAVDIAAKTLSLGGRIIYVGAGSSGRIAILDASECPPTFGVEESTVIAIIAGGHDAVFRAVPGFEDSSVAGRNDMLGLSPTEIDFAVGISASGSASYVVGALNVARENGAKTASITSNHNAPISKDVNVEIVTPTGAEPITGSTRMKAGNAQKMVLNMISTGAMIKTGKVRENLMINLKPSSEKLRKRMIRIVIELGKVSEMEAVSLLGKYEWNILKALDSIENIK